jgi:uncharacterized membrane protein YcgQ (UPF0703/DUF1980 family)
MFKFSQNNYKPMKYLYKMLLAIACLAVISCGKKNNNDTIVPHTIKVSASGTAQFTTVVSAIRSSEVTAATLDTKTVTTGSYEYSTSLNAGDLIRVEIQTSGENTINYAITDNGTTITQEVGKELGSFTKVNAEYTVK